MELPMACNQPILVYRVHSITNETFRQMNSEKRRKEKKVGKGTLCAHSQASSKEKEMPLAIS